MIARQLKETFLWGKIAWSARWKPYKQAKKRSIDLSFEQKDAIKGFGGAGSNRYLVTLPIPKILSGILSKKKSGGGVRIFLASLSPFQTKIFDYLIPCAIKPDTKELDSPISNQPFLFLTVIHSTCSGKWFQLNLMGRRFRLGQHLRKGENSWR